MISEFMTQSHRECDELFAVAEAAAGDGDLARTRQAHAAFAAALLHHLAMEENVLFPDFEAATGMTAGPTAVMRMEHGQMRGLFTQMQQALDSAALEGYLGAAETLLILIQQHNMKEEHMLYPMCDRAVGDDAGVIIGRMQAV